MPHVAGEGYYAVHAWVDENFELVLAGVKSFDFGNYTAQSVAAHDLVHALRQAGVKGELLEQIENLPPVPFPRGEEPAFAAQKSMSIFGNVYSALKKAGEKFLSGVKRLFGF